MFFEAASGIGCLVMSSRCSKHIHILARAEGQIHLVAAMGPLRDVYLLQHDLFSVTLRLHVHASAGNPLETETC